MSVLYAIRILHEFMSQTLIETLSSFIDILYQSIAIICDMHE